MARPRLLWSLFSILLGLGLVTDAGAGGSLPERLESVLASRPLRRAKVAVLVERASDGKVLFARNPELALTPASNQKILTAIACLAAFGPTYRFETVIYADRPLDADGEVGQLLVKGSGDPVLNSEDWWRIAAALRRDGLRRVRGDLVLDDSVFDRKRWHSSWGTVSARAYHAPVGALTANYGAFSVTVEAGARQGDPVRVVIDPPVPYLQLVNRAKTGSSRARRTLVVDRSAAPEREIVRVHGVVRAGDPPKMVYRSVLDPARYAGAVFRMQLAANGIELEGAAQLGRVGSEAHELLRFEGRPLAEIVRLFVKYSNNAVAESLVKAMGASRTGGVGSWSSGTPAVRERLVSLGLDSADFLLVDGSGLSYRNKVTPRALVKALRVAGDSFRFGPELIAALPIAARDGTLEDRAEGAAGVVRAKTGLLNGVAALSGFAELGSGEDAVFSILVNGYRISDEEVMDALDRFVEELVRPPAPRPAVQQAGESFQPGSKPAGDTALR
jgi:D-alanyl-D-alanine carboxypeptidase/D-alanyl-D-alanine-endopeptidase (penicillin-binding protein 4)